MVEYIKKLKQCIKWFQELEYSYLLEQKKLQDELESSEIKFSEMGIFQDLVFLMFCMIVKPFLLFIDRFFVVVCICFSIEMIVKKKEEELNSIVVELRKNNAFLQEKFSKEESDKLVSFVSCF